MHTMWFVSIGLVATLWSAPVFAQSQQGVVHLDFQADVQADGVLANIQPNASLAPPMQAVVSRRVAEWRYRPGTWQGLPVPGKVSQRIVAEVVPGVSGSFALRIREVMAVPAALDTSRPRAAPRMFPPRYPTDAQRSGIEANLVYAMQLDAQGKPFEVELLDAQVPEPWREQFDAVSRGAIQQWRLEPVEVDGQAIDCRLLIPMTFRLAVGNTPPTPTPVHDLRPYLPRFPDACPLQPVLETKAEGTHL